MNTTFSYPFSGTLRHVFASLKQRKAMTAVIVSVIGLFTAILFLNTQFCNSVVRRANEQVNPAAAKRVILTQGAECSARGFSPQLLNKIQSLPEVETAEPYYEVSVDVCKRGQRRTHLTVMESADEDDLLFNSKMLKMGTPLTHKKQIVLGQTLANKLGVEKAGEILIVSMTRTINGIPEQCGGEFVVTGIVRGDDRCYCLTETAAAFDRWAAHSSDADSTETRRAKLYLRSPEDAESISKRFIPAGYLVEQHLDKIKDLQELKSRMNGLQGMLSSTSCVFCLVTLVLCSYFVYKTKQPQFRTMRLRGIPNHCLHYAVQTEGLVYGVLSLGIAVLIIFAAANPYQRIMEHIFAMPPDNVAVGLFAAGDFVSFCLAVGSIVAAVLLMQFLQMFFLCCGKQTGKI